MAKHHRFRPTILDALEHRALLSTAAAAPLITVGALGDSYTDEYRFYPPDRSQARNWVEILADDHLANFGAYSTTSRGEPRDQGFAFNWARSDATSSNLIANQLPGLKAQVAAGQVQYAWIFTGGNDFLFDLQAAVKSGKLTGSGPIAQLAQVEARAQANVTRAVATLLNANPKVRIAVGTLPDIRNLPIVQTVAAALPQSGPLIAATSQQIAKYNTFLRNLAAHNPRIAVADLANASAGLTSAKSSTVKFGGINVNLRTAGDDYHDFFLADGIHVGTIVQGVIADTFLAAIDAKFHAGVPLLTQTQIVQFASHVQPSTQ